MDKTQIPAIKHREIAPTRAWIIANFRDRTVRFAFPPFQGSHQECYQAIAKDKELASAEGLDLALLANGAYTQNTPQWNFVRENFRSNWVRVPNRVLLIPAGYIKGDNALSGILVERDIQGNGLSTKMSVPNLESWKQNREGVYVPSDLTYKSVFVPSTAYEGKSFEKDGIVHAHLTPEGAGIFARTARDAELTPYNGLADRMKDITSPEQRVSLLDGGGGGLGLHSNWGGYCGFAFGVSVSCEVSRSERPKNLG